MADGSSFSFSGRLLLGEKIRQMKNCNYTYVFNLYVGQEKGGQRKKTLYICFQFVLIAYVFNLYHVVIDFYCQRKKTQIVLRDFYGWSSSTLVINICAWLLKDAGKAE
nr:hypothetical protein Iba_scaffold1393CG0620 [Ipomoea batatas]GME11396.1 hypothetical protein Iba_scaffold11587CG0010 [Ipomoea batatas]